MKILVLFFLSAVERAVFGNAHTGSAAAGQLAVAHPVDPAAAGDQHQPDHPLTEHAGQPRPPAGSGCRLAAAGQLVGLSVVQT